MVHTSRQMGAARLAALDTAMQAAGATKKAAKDVDLEGTMLALGCHISNCPPLVEPVAETIARL